MQQIITTVITVVQACHTVLGPSSHMPVMLVPGDISTYAM